ncbi:uncharacterized protein LOC127856332 [Dreissena polymorpha]|uniref:uncharacterized protein LOC127856332 n=1 Tax=Dreissena polymorpha TaxID=45954 RepID=UPI0022646E9E|nr:uncharacterized protein LOC127856332 [Dreissena polymorpha]
MFADDYWRSNLNMRNISAFLFVFACAIDTSGADGQSWNDFETLRRPNCSECRKRLQVSIIELTKLTEIKNRILNAIGRNRLGTVGNLTGPIPPFRFDLASVHNEEDPLPNNMMRSRLQHNVTNHMQNYKNVEIYSYSKPVGPESDNTLRFSLGKNEIPAEADAVEAALLVYADRRRRIRPEGRGKRIYISVSYLDDGNGHWLPVSSMKTLIKRRQWKRILLPIAVGQRLLESAQKSVDIKVDCEGCGRLVQLTLDKDRQRMWKNNTSKQKKRAKTSSRKDDKRPKVKIQKVDKQNDIKMNKKDSDRKANKHKRNPILVLSLKAPLS